MIFEPQVIHLDAVIDEYVNVSVGEENIVPVDASVLITHAEADYYEGEYEFTPQADSEIVIATNNKLMTNDIIIAPIPNNYGLITWDGSVLTVS